jgi:quercetin dioxygenase-like cupin family protein
MRLSVSVLLLAGLAASTLAQAQPVKPDPSHIPFKLPKDIKWTIDPNFGEENANLVGDPSKPGPYVMLIRWKPHQMSRPHYHNSVRNVYVVSGTWWVSDSGHYDPDKTYPVPAGSFAQDMPGQVHWDGAKDEPVVLELMGMGPANTVKVPDTGKK